MPDSRDQGFARLFADSRQALSRYVLRLVRSRSAAEEIVQEAFLRIYTSGVAANPARPYLFTIARNLASNARRHDRVVDAVSAKDVDVGELYSSGGSPEEAALTDERIRLLHEAVDNLPPQCRAAFTLRMFNDCSYKEIAVRLGISTKTVEKHIALGVGEIHAALARRYKDVKAP